MLENEIQQRFFDLIRSDKKTGKSILVYQELVRYRFEEVLLKTFPRSAALLGEKRWNRLIEEFIRTGASNPLIWKMPKEFLAFAKKKAKLKIKYLNDLLWFEWIEVESAMATEKTRASDGFSWEKPAKLGAGTKIKKLNYSVFSDSIKKGKFYVMFYTDTLGDTYWMEITSFMFDFLRELKNVDSLDEAIKNCAAKYLADFKDSKEIIENTLIEFYDKGIIVQ